MTTVDRLAILQRGKANRTGSGANPLVPSPTAGAAALPSPIDPAAVTGTPEERLRAFEGAIDAATSSVRRAVASAKERFVVEAGIALREIRDQELYKVTHATFEAYVGERWTISRPRAYELIDAAPKMIAVSALVDTPVVESHARILAPILEQHGPDAAREVIAKAQADAGPSGGRLTAAALKRAQRQAGYAPRREAPTPSPAAPARPQRSAVERLDEALERLGRTSNLLTQTAVHDATGEHPVHAARTLNAITREFVSLAHALGLTVVGSDGKALER